MLHAELLIEVILLRKGREIRNNEADLTVCSKVSERLLQVFLHIQEVFQHPLQNDHVKFLLRELRNFLPQCTGNDTNALAPLYGLTIFARRFQSNEVLDTVLLQKMEQTALAAAHLQNCIPRFDVSQQKTDKALPHITGLRQCLIRRRLVLRQLFIVHRKRHRFYNIARKHHAAHIALQHVIVCKRNNLIHSTKVTMKELRMLLSATYRTWTHFYRTFPNKKRLSQQLPRERCAAPHVTTDASAEQNIIVARTQPVARTNRAHILRRKHIART